MQCIMKRNRRHFKKPDQFHIFVLLAVILACAIALIILLSPSGPPECDTEYCFVERANEWRVQLL